MNPNSKYSHLVYGLYSDGYRVVVYHYGKAVARGTAPTYLKGLYKARKTIHALKKQQPVETVTSMIPTMHNVTGE